MGSLAYTGHVTRETYEAGRPANDELLPQPPVRRIVLDMPSWLPTEKVPRWFLIGLLAVLLMAVAAGTTVPFALGWLDQENLKALGYPGIFLANFLGTATVFVPVPGLTAAGQTLIVLGADTLFKPGVVAGAAGMTLAESTAYLAGTVARGVAEERQMPLGGRLGRWLHRAAAWIDCLMARYGFVTLLVLAGVPNPLFEFAGITAGAVRMNFWRFLLAVAIGKTMRALMLAFVGGWLFGPTEI